MTQEATFPHSTNIAAASYDPDGQVMTIEFKNGGIYRAQSVPEAKWHAFAQSTSPGSFYHRRLRTEHVWERQGE